MSDDEKLPEDLEAFVQQVFGDSGAAEEFTKSVEANQMVEAWQGLYEIYLGLRSGGFNAMQANGIFGAYLFHLISSMEGNL